ncbi:MAG: winged helix-turn-helix domain-containing protein [Candidatus Nanohaloarchaea archaeon]
MEDRIGETAGYVWDYLEAEGESSVTSVVNAIEVPSTKVYMAIGWLAKEDEVEFIEKGRGNAVRLK